MRVLSAVCLAAAIAAAAPHAFGQQVAAPAGGPTSIVQLLPADTQGCVRVDDLPKFVERWNETQLGKLGNDPRLKPFWDEQRAELTRRFAEAGWQLNLRADDLYKISSGQAGVAWVAQAQNTRRPYAVCLIMDIQGKRPQAEQLLARVDAELRKRGATAADLQAAGAAVREYTLPRSPNETIIRQTYYTLTADQLFATDDLTLLSNLIDASKNGGFASPLAQEAVYQKATAELGQGEFDVEYFVRPIGLAKAIRSISGRPARGQTDVLKVLENQGFDSLAAAAGRVRLGQEDFDVLHDAFVLLRQPVPEAVQVLDFPNTAAGDVPAWIPADASSATSFAWDANEAFWKVRSIVDEIANQEGTFDNVIEGIQEDPLGPRIDIRNEVLPQLNGQFYVMTDTVQPITVESRRALVAIGVNDPEDTLRKAVERAMKNEPGVEIVDYKDIRIFKVNRGDDELEGVDIDTDFGNFGTKDDNFGDAQNEEPLLNQWAIAKFDDYLLFASHFELIQVVIDRLQGGAEGQSLAAEPDVQRVLESLQQAFPEDDQCAWRVIRADRSFEMQYELFRTGQLDQSQSILASLLDRLLRPRDLPAVTPQPLLKGDRLPPYDQVRQFLMPIGYIARTGADGWSIKSFVLGKE